MVATTICSAIGSAHWEIGKLLHDRKLESKHGSGVVNRLSYDLKQRYPQMGLSPRNLWDMKKFYERFCDYPDCDYLDNEHLQIVCEMAGAFGYSPDDVDCLLAEGYTPDEIEEFFYGIEE